MKYLSIPTYKTTIISILLLLLVAKIGFNEDWTLLTQSIFVLAVCGIFHFLFKKIAPAVNSGFNMLLMGPLQKFLKKLHLEKLSHPGEVHTFSDIRNSFIIGLIVLLIISSFQTGTLGVLSLILFVLATFIIRSIVRWNSSPIFNPVAIASLVLIFVNQIYDTELFIGWGGVNYSIEAFGETIQFGTYISMLGALLSVYFSKKYLYTLVFFVTFSILGYSFLGAEDMNYLLLDGTLYFFFGIMILEPKTSVSGKYQWAYGILLAIILIGLLKFHITGDYILAICLINLAYFIGKNWIHKQVLTRVDYPKGQKWLCEPCGYIYDPVQGDIDSGIAPGTEFTDIPDTWFCPVCGVTKADFILLDTSKRYEVVIKEKTLLNSVTLKLVIETTETLASIAGQFISFYWKDSEGEFSRSYSIAEHTGNSYTFLIKLTEKGRGAKMLKSLAIGQKIEIHGVSGKFILKSSNHPKVFIATGTGLAPIYNMICSLPEESKKTLYFTVATQEELFFLEELSQIKNLNYFVHLTKEQIDGYYFGRVDTDIIEAGKNTEWHLCGSPKMVEEATKKLKKRGFEVVLSEEFN